MASETTAAAATVNAASEILPDQTPSLLLDGALPFLSYAIILPFRWIFVLGLPAFFFGVLAAVRVVARWLFLLLTTVLWPILFPLKVLFVWPTLWTLNFLYQVSGLLVGVCTRSL